MFPDIWLLCFQPEHLPGLPHPSAKGTLLLFTLIRSNSCLHLLVCAGSPSTTPESMETPVSLFSTSWPWYYKTILCLYTLPTPDCLCVSLTFYITTSLWKQTNSEWTKFSKDVNRAVQHTPQLAITDISHLLPWRTFFMQDQRRHTFFKLRMSGLCSH